MHSEQRKSFQIIVAALSVSLSLFCWAVVRPHVPKTENLAQLGFALLLLVAIPGFMSIFKVILPIVILKIWPQLDKPKQTQPNKIGESL